jgi:hypothetical protein
LLHFPILLPVYDTPSIPGPLPLQHLIVIFRASRSPKSSIEHRFSGWLLSTLVFDPFGFALLSVYTSQP